MSRWSEQWDRQRGIDVEATREMEFESPRGGRASGGGPSLGPPRGPDASDAGLSRIIFPPRMEKLASSQDFRIRNFQLVLAAGAGSEVTLAGFQLPQGQVGWLQVFSLYVLTPTAATDVRWQVRINQGPVPGWESVANPPGIAQFIVIGDDDMRVRLPGNCLVDVLITNQNASGPWTVGAELQGWYHPEIAERRAWNLDL